MRHNSRILWLSATDARVTEAHVNSRDSTRKRRLPPLCPSPSRLGIILKGHRWTTGVTTEEPQQHLRAIYYRRKSDRDARQFYRLDQAETVTSFVPLSQAGRE